MTKATIDAEIDAQLPTNNVNAITAAILRGVLHDCNMDWPHIELPNIWTSLQTFNSGITLNTSGLGSGLLTSQVATGASASNAVMNFINIPTDTAALTGTAGVIGLAINDINAGGAAFNGGRTMLSANLGITHAINPAATQQFYIAGAFGVTAGVNLNGTNFGAGGRGIIQSIITQTTALAGATFLDEVNSAEFDILVATGASVKNKTALTVVQNATDAVQGTNYDAAYVASNNTGAVGWKAIFQAADSNGTTPLAATGTLMNLQFATPTTIANGVDLTNGGSNITITGSAFKSPGFSVSGAGALVATGLRGPNSMAAPLVIAGSASAQSHTGDTNPTTLVTVPVPANSMGINGTLRITVQWSFTNNANAKTVEVKFGGTTYLSLAQANQASARNQVQLQNRGATNSQVGNAVNASQGSSTTAATTSAIDTTTSQNITFVVTCGNAADTITLESYLVELLFQ